MAEYTPNLNLLKKDPATDGNDTFNIKTMLNDNWDKIDGKVGDIDTNKVDKVEGKQLSTEDYTTEEKEKLGGIADGATKVEDSATNGNIKINGAETNVYTHPGSGTNPHGTTKSDVGLGAVDNAKQATKTEFDSHVANKIQHIPYATASGTNTYTVSISGISSLAEGLSVKVKFTNANTGTATLNVNSLGAKSIVKSNGNALSSGNIKAGQICHLVYTGSNFQLLGEGGEYGTAQAGDVLSGKTIGTESGLITGTMPNRGAISNTITTQNGQIAVPQGYHNGSGTIKAQFANLTSSNIKDGVNIGGVVGTLKPATNYYVSGSTKNYVDRKLDEPIIKNGSFSWYRLPAITVLDLINGFGHVSLKTLVNQSGFVSWKYAVTFRGILNGEIATEDIYVGGINDTALCPTISFEVSDNDEIAIEIKGTPEGDPLDFEINGYRVFWGLTRSNLNPAFTSL